MVREEYIVLYQKYLTGNATPDEIELLFSYKDKFDLERFDNDEVISDQEIIKARIYHRINKSIPKYPFRKSSGRFWLPIAASILISTFIGLYFARNHFDKSKNRLAQVSKLAGVIVPGTNKAILILGNGKKVDLNQTSNGQISKAGKILITKIKNGELVYKNIDNQSNKTAEASYNTIITPRGGQYQVILPDGTAVWLNAASSLKYPTTFTGSERHVELNGEAYFEVAKNKDMPFTIAAGKVNIKVLGTHFNVSAYDDDRCNKTTLLEGSVLLTKDDQKVLLIPGEQAVSENNSQQIRLKTVNVDDAIAWKNGYFSFRKEDIRSVMRKIARWYNVDVEFQGEVSNRTLGGSILRTQSIEEILSYLELTGIAQFKIKERRIIVNKN